LTPLVQFGFRLSDNTACLLGSTFNDRGIQVKHPAISICFLLAIASQNLAHADQASETIAQLDASLAKFGMARTEGAEEVKGRLVPSLFFGDHKINNQYDVVDALQKANWATATVFVKDGAEFVRVSTNVLTPDHKRGVGTLLAHNVAYEALLKGTNYCGPIDVLGTPYEACYHPIKDRVGTIVGASYIGYKK